MAVPKAADGAGHVYHQYTIRVPEDRDGLARALHDEHRIGTGVYYPTPVHRLAPFRVDPRAEQDQPDLPHTRRAAAEVLSLPVYPTLGDRELERIVTAVNAVSKAGGR